MRRPYVVLVAGAAVTVLGAATAVASPTGRDSEASGAAGAARFATAGNSSWIAGYSSGLPYRRALRLSGIIRVPSLSCSNKNHQSVVAGITANDSTGSDFFRAELVMSCQNGNANFYPAFDYEGSGSVSRPQDRAQPGDTIQLAVVLTKAQDVVSIVDKTHGFNVSYGEGGRGSGGSWLGVIGEFPWQPTEYSRQQPVPAFGKLHFSHVRLNGSPIGSMKGVVREQWKGKIATSALGKDEESFTTTFEHS